jgi:hypothetical protein
MTMLVSSVVEHLSGCLARTGCPRYDGYLFQ